MADQSNGVGIAVASIKYVRQTGWKVQLSVIVNAPDDHRSVTLDGETVVFPSANGDDIVQSHRNVALSRSVQPPSDDCAVTFQGEVVVVPGGNRFYTIQSSRNCLNPPAVAA